MVQKVGMYISRDRAIRNGRPCITGTAIEVGDVARCIQLGYSRQEILGQYPSLTAESLDACLAFAFVDRASQLQPYCA